MSITIVSSENITIIRGIMIVIPVTLNKIEAWDKIESIFRLSVSMSELFSIDPFKINYFL